MTRFIPLIIILSSIYGCGGSSEGSDSNLANRNSSSIVGDWSTKLERNGAIGESHWVFSEGSFDTYEIGNGQIMDEWHSGLDIDKTYKFTVDGSEGTFIVNGDMLKYTISSEQSSTARIFELPSEVEVYSWEIGNGDAGEEYNFEYKLVDDSLTLTFPDQKQLIYTLVK